MPKSRHVRLCPTSSTTAQALAQPSALELTGRSVLDALRYRGFLTVYEIAHMWAVFGAQDDEPQRRCVVPGLQDAVAGLILWDGVTAGFQRVWDALQTHGGLWLVPAPVLLYVEAGVVLDLPIADPLRYEGYPTPHWLPMVIRPHPAGMQHPWFPSPGLQWTARSYQVSTQPWTAEAVEKVRGGYYPPLVPPARTEAEGPYER
jgi:hypothetical protein